MANCIWISSSDLHHPRKVDTDTPISRTTAAMHLSNKEVGRIKKWVRDKEMEDRKCNIAIKEMEMTVELEEKEREGEKWVERLLKEKLEVECKVESCRKSKPVIIAKIEGEGKR